MDEDDKPSGSGGSLILAREKQSSKISTATTTIKRYNCSSVSKSNSNNDRGDSSQDKSKLIIMQPRMIRRRNRTINLCQSHCHNRSNWFIIMAMISVAVQAGLVRAQCPWARDSSDLHSDCICDFNPQLSSNGQPAQQQQQATPAPTTVNTGDTSQSPAPMITRRMSVQCAPVDFEQLLRALKQTASIELPWQLAKRTFAVDNSAHNSTGPVVVADLVANQSRRLRPGNDDDEEEEKLSERDGKHSDDSDEDDDDEASLEETRIRFISQAKLDLLHVSNSTIGKLEDNTFILDTRQRLEGMTSTHLVVAIQALHLSRCGIYHIAPGAFNGLEWSLTSLSLNDNQLETIASGAINKLINLRLLDLSSNRIKFIGAGAFLKLNKLNTLRLADNRQIGSGSSSSNRLKMANSANSEQGIDLNAFEGLEASLNDLNLKNNQLGEFPAAISKLKSLAFLNLAQNHIARVPGLMFKQMATLTAINLERNRISSIENETFVGVELTLSSLSLLGNLIESFPVQQLAQLRALRRLDLGFNRIESLPVNSFVNSTRLILVALDGNPLETLPELAFKPLEGTLRGLSVGGKLLNCDCRLSWMLRWQLEHGLQISSRERAPQFCAKPNYLRSLVSFAALKPEHLTCEPSSSSSAFPPPSLTMTQLASSLGAATIAGLRVSPYGQAGPALASNGGWSASGVSANELTYFTLSDSQPPPTTTSTTTKSTTPAAAEASSPDPSSTPSSINTTTTVSTAELVPADRLTEVSFSPNSLENSTRPLDDSLSSETTYSTPAITLDTVTSAVDSQSTGTTTTTITRDDSGSLELTGEASTIATSTQNKLLALGELPDDELFVAAPHDTPYANRHKLSRHGYLASTPNDLMRYNKTTTTTSGSFSSGRTNSTTSTSTSTNAENQIHHFHNHKHQNVFSKQPGKQIAAQQGAIFASNNHSAPIPQRHVLKQQQQQSGGTVQIIQSVFGERQQQQQQSTTTTGAGSTNSLTTQVTSDDLPARRESGRPPVAVVVTSASTAGQRLSQQQQQQVPAVPTTINVYKMPVATNQQAATIPTSGLVVEQQHLNHQSQRLNKSHQHRHQDSSSSIGSLLPSKGARFVDDTTLPSHMTTTTTPPPPPTTTAATTSTAASVVSTASSASSFKRGFKVRPRIVTTTTTTTSAPDVAEMEIERYSQPAASVIQSQFTAYVRQQPPPVSMPADSSTFTRSASPAEPTSSPTRPTAAPTTTTTTTTSSPTLIMGTPMETYAIQPQTYMQPQFNTRQSVSSMYRLANAGAPKPTVPSQHHYTSTSVAPTTTTTSAAITQSSTTTTTTTTTASPTIKRNTTGGQDVAATGATTRISSQEPLADSAATTRMAATVRIVDSLPQVRYVTLSSSSSAKPTASPTISTTTTSTTTTTPPPQTTTSSTTTTTSTTAPLPPKTTTATTIESRAEVVELAADFRLPGPDVMGPRSVTSSQSPSPANPQSSTTASQASVSIAGSSSASNNPRGHSNHQYNIGRQFGDESAHNSGGTLSTTTMDEMTSGHHHHNQNQHHLHYPTTQFVPQSTAAAATTTTTAATQQHQNRLSSSNLVTKETSSSQGQQRQQSLSNQFFDSSSKLLVKRFPKLADFDQVALVLAGFLCVCTFLIALIAIICTCCCSPKRGLKPALTRLDSSQASCSPTNLSSSLTARASEHHHHHHHHHRHQHNAPSNSDISQNNWLIRLLCCCFRCKQSSSSLTTPIQSLILQDDDNSTASSGDNGSSSSSGLNGKSLLLAGVQLGQGKGQQNGLANGRDRRHCLKSNTLNQRKSLKSAARLGPLNLEASMRLHRQAHAIDKGTASGGYFLGMMSDDIGSRTNGRRKSRWASEMDLDQQTVAGGCHRRGKLARKCTIGGGGSGWMSDSCDSDKSCSPGANRNNRYNISDAHKAYLAGKQIQASMFVTTQSGGTDSIVPAAGAVMQSNPGYGPTDGQSQRIAGSSGGRRFGGLLKTIDLHNSSVNVHNSSHNQAADYFGNCNLSDRSTTDDSRAPLDRLSPQQRDIMPAPPPPSSGGGTGFHINRSISMSSKFPIVGRAAAAATTSFGQIMSQRSSDQARGNHSHNQNQNYHNQHQQHQHHNHHYNQQQSSSSNHNNQRIYELSTGDLLPISAEEEWPEPYVDPVSANSKDLFASQTNCNDNNNGSQLLYCVNNENSASSSAANRQPHPHAHDHQFNSVDNNHCQDRQFDVDYIQQAQVISSHLLTNRSYDEAYLANWRTIGRNPNKSTSDPSDRPTTMGGGGANWLRWTPADDGS